MCDWGGGPNGMTGYYRPPEPKDFGEDNSKHDTDCDCKACLIDTWHAEVEELRKENKRLRSQLDVR